MTNREVIVCTREQSQDLARHMGLLDDMSGYGTQLTHLYGREAAQWRRDRVLRGESTIERRQPDQHSACAIDGIQGFHVDGTHSAAQVLLSRT